MELLLTVSLLQFDVRRLTKAVKSGVDTHTHIENLSLVAARVSKFKISSTRRVKLELKAVVVLQLPDLARAPG